MANVPVPANRLEAATSRLEDLAVAHTNDFREVQAAQRSSATPSLPLSKEATPQFNTGVFSPESRNSVASEPIIEEEKKSPVITDYEKLIKDQVEPWISKSEKIGSFVGEQVHSLPLRLATYCSRPPRSVICFRRSWVFFRSFRKRRSLLLPRYPGNPRPLNLTQQGPTRAIDSYATGLRCRHFHS